MHILIVNDDGPPSSHSSPYVHSLVRTLQKNNHTVSVVLPNVQRSWIGKAHIVGQAIRPTYYRPHPSTEPNAAAADSGTTSTHPLPDSSKEEEWILVDSTPASCVQIGLFHYFSERGPIDLVVSGPNYGRNTTALFALSSGTIGGAMEAAACDKRAIALSYAFFDRTNDPEVIAAASRKSVSVIEYLANNWDKDVHLYTINVPLVRQVEGAKVLWTSMLQNTWKSGSCFQAIEVPESEDRDADEAEEELRRAESRDGAEEQAAEADGSGEHLRYKHRHFKWAPKFKDVYDSVEQAPPGNDGWAVKEGHVSVTPLKANFMHVAGFEGEVKL
ncbi:sure-like protein [Rhizodiscina lignyota]|uniref:Sure-like protein n=1 Tax=Rhizodiscina lignyota TaxID=1504668 RepID=A0A9P4IJI4_9PEZI|nr:sure-like protein [Rhizodiscina lignyota]